MYRSLTYLSMRSSCDSFCKLARRTLIVLCSCTGDLAFHSAFSHCLSPILYDRAPLQTKRPVTVELACMNKQWPLCICCVGILSGSKNVTAEFICLYLEDIAV